MSSTMGERMPVPITSPFRGFRVGVGVGTAVGTGEGVGEGRAVGAGVAVTGAAVRSWMGGVGVTRTTCSLRLRSGCSTATARKESCRYSRTYSPPARIRPSTKIDRSQTSTAVVLFRLFFCCGCFSMVCLPFS